MTTVANTSSFDGEIDTTMPLQGLASTNSGKALLGALQLKDDLASEDQQTLEVEGIPLVSPRSPLEAVSTAFSDAAAKQTLSFNFARFVREEALSLRLRIPVKLLRKVERKTTRYNATFGGKDELITLEQTVMLLTEGPKSNTRSVLENASELEQTFYNHRLLQHYTTQYRLELARQAKEKYVVILKSAIEQALLQAHNLKQISDEEYQQAIKRLNEEDLIALVNQSAPDLLVLMALWDDTLTKTVFNLSLDSDYRAAKLAKQDALIRAPVAPKEPRILDITYSSEQKNNVIKLAVHGAKDKRHPFLSIVQGGTLIKNKLKAKKASAKPDSRLAKSFLNYCKTAIKVYLPEWLDSSRLRRIFFPIAALFHKAVNKIFELFIPKNSNVQIGVDKEGYHADIVDEHGKPVGRFGQAKQYADHFLGPLKALRNTTAAHLRALRLANTIPEAADVIKQFGFMVQKVYGQEGSYPVRKVAVFLDKIAGESATLMLKAHQADPENAETVRASVTDFMARLTESMESPADFVEKVSEIASNPTAILSASSTQTASTWLDSLLASPVTQKLAVKANDAVTAITGNENVAKTLSQTAMATSKVAHTLNAPEPAKIITPSTASTLMDPQLAKTLAAADTTLYRKSFFTATCPPAVGRMLHGCRSRVREAASIEEQYRPMRAGG